MYDLKCYIKCDFPDPETYSMLNLLYNKNVLKCESFQLMEKYTTDRIQ